MLNELQRKRITVIAQYCTEVFSEGDWSQLSFITGEDELIYSHSRLLRSLNFGDNDYPAHVMDVIGEICTKNPAQIDSIIDHFDIDLWYQAKEPKRFERVFGVEHLVDVQFWSETNLRAFFSHLASNRERVGRLARSLQTWGIATFVAHDDIEPSLEWMREIEKALMTMDIQIAVLEDGFKESNWCDQEIGFALGRRVDIIPLRNGIDPYGFLGKFQGLQIKGKYSEDISYELIKLILKKPRASMKLLSTLPTALSKLKSDIKTKRLKLLFEWKTLSSEQLKSTLENSSLTSNEKAFLIDEIKTVGAFSEKSKEKLEDDVPF